jgi:hypothetical protein
VDSGFAEDDRDTNELEPIQAYGELYFAADRPVSLRAGRFAFEVMDRRLIARNEWRNTTNTFQGLRATIGDARSDWQLDLLALQPLQRQLDRLDTRDAERWLLGLVGDWRDGPGTSRLQPYWLLLDQSADPAEGRLARRINTTGLRVFGATGTTGFDYDVNLAWQFGRDGTASHRAFAGVVDGGYTFDSSWQPRLSLQYVWATGDESPTDARSGRFERLFGFARPFSANDYFQFENLRAPKLRIEATPARWLRVDARGCGL